MRKRRYMLEKMAIATELSDEPIPNQVLVEIAGERRVLIENHYGVTGYGTREICVKIKCGHIVVWGEQLELVRMTKDQLVIMGEINGIRFCRGGK